MEMSSQVKSKYSIQEVCSSTGVKSYVLRFWESEFDDISPDVDSSGFKTYSARDIDAVKIAKKLLFDEKCSIERAKNELPKILATWNEEEVEIEEQEENALATEIEKEVLVDDVLAEKPVLDEDSMFTTDFSDKELQKLVLAKAKLNSLINLADTLI